MEQILYSTYVSQIAIFEQIYHWLLAEIFVQFL